LTGESIHPNFHSAQEFAFGRIPIPNLFGNNLNHGNTRVCGIAFMNTILEVTKPSACSSRPIFIDYFSVIDELSLSSDARQGQESGEEQQWSTHEAQAVVVGFINATLTCSSFFISSNLCETLLARKTNFCSLSSLARGEMREKKKRAIDSVQDAGAIALECK